MGVVASLQDEGDVVVRYSNNKVFLLSPTTLTKVGETPPLLYNYGDVMWCVARLISQCIAMATWFECLKTCSKCVPCSVVMVTGTMTWHWCVFLCVIC